MDQQVPEGQAAQGGQELPRVRAAGHWDPVDALGDLRDLRRDVQQIRHFQDRERERERDRERRAERHGERQAFLPADPDQEVVPDIRAPPPPAPRNNKNKVKI